MKANLSFRNKKRQSYFDSKEVGTDLFTCSLVIEPASAQELQKAKAAGQAFRSKRIKSRLLAAFLAIVLFAVLGYFLMQSLN